MTGYQFSRLRIRVFEVIEKDKTNDRLSRIYDGYMLITILLSLLPLTAKQWTGPHILIDRITTVLFILDYLLRWATADLLDATHKRRHITHRWRAFLLYPLTPMAVIDLMSILPTLTFVYTASSAVGTLRILRLTRAIRCMRVFKFLRYSQQFNRILRVFRQEQQVLYAVLGLAVGYIFACAITMFSLEPTNFPTFFDAIYWASSTLTTVGYGDVHPVTHNGQILSMIAALFGIAIVALPSGIITAAFLEDFNRTAAEQTQEMRAHNEEFERELHALHQEIDAFQAEMEQEDSGQG
ncbi:MAG: ion transporter [Butyricicoccaceae bacterium]